MVRVRGVVVRAWQRLDERDRAFVAQVARYGVAGVGVTVFQIAVYNALSGPARIGPLIANTVAYLAALAVGYTVHSRYTFRGHGSGDARRTGPRFVAATLVGFAMNSAWVGLFVHQLHWPAWTPSLPMFFATPAVLFWLNRLWVFE